MINDEIRQVLEKGDLEGAADRVATLVAQEQDPGALPLGILLALSIAKELGQGKAPGTDTATLVQSWTAQWGESRVEQAVDFARGFLLKPKELMSLIRSRLEPSEEI